MRSREQCSRYLCATVEVVIKTQVSDEWSTERVSETSDGSDRWWVRESEKDLGRGDVRLRGARAVHMRTSLGRRRARTNSAASLPRESWRWSSRLAALLGVVLRGGTLLVQRSSMDSFYSARFVN